MLDVVIGVDGDARDDGAAEVARVLELVDDERDAHFGVGDGLDVAERSVLVRLDVVGAVAQLGDGGADGLDEDHLVLVLLLGDLGEHDGLVPALELVDCHALGGREAVGRQVAQRHEVGERGDLGRGVGRERRLGLEARVHAAALDG